MKQRQAKRPIGVSRGRQQIEKLTAQRTERRDTRLYAEQWYNALYIWDVRVVKILSSFHYEPHSDLDFLTSGDAPAPLRYLKTPVGEFTEGEVGSIITEMSLSWVPEARQLGKMLDKLRREQSTCMGSLLRGASWSQHRERALRYGVAVLTLAVRLGDVYAEGPLQQVKQELSQLPLVNSVQSC
ncbi:hypothetical protein E7T06_07190 [Deinococcus sp. Arct2-2]|uniref:hypothetical protein n=1 Tax=Deinococcus sp. Arct2-2 TaxID=2568653 RepID=UPI0010A39355|nr:hypothetical protein [Deinococcus sp. Arct2-2]THF70483.1 hypothetical protein E7T06_07190 [Deinococcus sp. Arct2-2]